MFPANFLWGAATSSHQVEGHNSQNDWWQWEMEGRIREKSGQATNHYECFDQDFKLAHELGHNAHRFSIEWSRIEPREGVFDDQEIEHYRKVIDSLSAKSINPVLTLHHFTIPLWLAIQGGWLNKNAARIFARYVAKVVHAFHDKVRFWVTINEPVVLAYHGYLIGKWPPGEKSFSKALRVVNHLIDAHKLSYQVIRNQYAGKSIQPMVGIAKNFRVFRSCPNTPNFYCRLHSWWRHNMFNKYFLTRVKPEMDFIGVNYYESEFISNDPSLNFGLWGDNCNIAHQHPGHINKMGWLLNPRGLYEILSWLKRYHKPILITENGTAEDDDVFRRQFIIDHLREVENAVNHGVPVIGYFYWSLLDNFEWDKGFDTRFGLIEVDYATLKRTVRTSAHVYSNIIKVGAAPSHHS